VAGAVEGVEAIELKMGDFCDSTLNLTVGVKFGPTGGSAGIQMRVKVGRTVMTLGFVRSHKGGSTKHGPVGVSLDIGLVLREDLCCCDCPNDSSTLQKVPKLPVFTSSSSSNAEVVAWQSIVDKVTEFVTEFCKQLEGANNLS